MRKNKFLKTLGFSCMAVFMASLTILGGCSAPQLNNNVDKPPVSSSLGLDPKNDPVVYTTDSGLEIKMSNAAKYSGKTTLTTNNGNTHVQDLTSFYYFTMGTFSGTIYTAKTQYDTYSVANAPVNWIILGLGKNTGYFLDQVTQNLFSTWKTNSSGLSHENYNDIGGSYFFEEIYETVSPAGNAIYSELATKAYIMDKVKASIPVNPGNLNEIPEGCMLVISENLLGQTPANGTGALNASYWTGNSKTYGIYTGSSYGNRYRYYGKGNYIQNGQQGWTIPNNPGGTLYNYINNLFSKNNSTGAIEGNNNLGFTQAQANLIVPQQLYTYYSNGGSYHYQETPDTDGNTYYTMFPLAYRSTHSSTYQNFCIEDYLTTDSQKIASFIGSSTNLVYNYWLRSGGTGYNGNLGGQIKCGVDGICSDDTPGGSHGVRPAMVMRLQ